MSGTAAAAEVPRARRLGRRGLVSLREQLSERDLGVVGSVDQFRLLSARQIEALHFSASASALTAARSCRRVLERLTRDRLLVRLSRRIGGVRAGSASFIYALGPAGHRILHDDTTRRWREPSETFVVHTLAVAQLIVDLTVVARAGVTDLVGYETEPSCWRTFSNGLSGPATLKPDLFVTTADSTSELCWFVEIDLGTESSGAIRRKCQTYHDYWASGHEQHRHSVFPKVLWIADTERRAGLINRAITGARVLHQPLFAVIATAGATDVLAGLGLSADGATRREASAGSGTDEPGGPA